MVSGEALFNQLGILEKAIAQLKAALEQTFTEFIRDSTIKRFEIAYELLWKMVKRVAESEGFECQSPKTCFKLAYRMGLADDEDGLLALLDNRNLTVHIYDEKNANEVYNFIIDKGFALLENMTAEIRKRI